MEQAVSNMSRRKNNIAVIGVGLAYIAELVLGFLTRSHSSRQGDNDGVGLDFPRGSDKQLIYRRPLPVSRISLYCF